MSYEDQQAVIDIIKTVGLVLNISSATCGFITIVLVLMLRKFQPTVGKAVSFQLSFWIGLMDLFYHVTMSLVDIRSVLDNFHPRWFLVYLNWSNLFYPIVTTLLTACVAFDLHLTFLKRSHNKSRYVPFYAPGTLIFSFLISLPFFFIHNVFYEQGVIFAFPSTTFAIYFSIHFFCYSLWMTLAVVYCAIIVIAIIVKLIQGVKELQDASTFCHANKREYFDVTLHLVVRRLIFYPVVPILCQSVNMIYPLLPIEASPLSVVLLAYIQYCIQGIAHFTVFLLNPALYRAWYNFKRSLVKRYIFPSTSSSNYYFQLQNPQQVKTNFDTFDESIHKSTTEDSTMNSVLSQHYTFNDQSSSVQEPLTERAMRWIIRRFFVSAEISNDISSEFDANRTSDTLPTVNPRRSFRK